MAYNNNAKNKEEIKKPSAASRYIQRRKGRLLRSIWKLIGSLVALFIIYLLLSGVINQVKTGENLLNYSLDIGKKISHFFNGLLEGDSPLKITKDGIYFEDVTPPAEGAFGNLPPLDVEE